MLAPFVQGDREGFHAWVSKEAELLAEGAFGPQMLAEVRSAGCAGWGFFFKVWCGVTMACV